MNNRGAPQPPDSEMKESIKSELVDKKTPSKNKKGQNNEEQDEEENAEVKTVRAGLKPRWERRHRSSSATICQVCNIQLNSNAQAQIHYRGKTHQRRLRRLAKAVRAGCTGALAQKQLHPLLSALPLPGRALQPQSQLEHFLPLRVNGSSPLSLFPNFNTMDPIQKAVINHTFGLTQPKRKPIISCNICHLRFNSTIQAEAHYKGHKHARKLKALETQRTRQKNGRSQSTTGRDKEESLMGGEAVSADSQLEDETGSSPSSLLLPENLHGSSTVASPTSQTSPTDSLLPTSPPSPQVAPSSQLCDGPSDGPKAEGCSPTTSAGLQSDALQSCMGDEDAADQVEKVKEAKSNKKHIHCPTCKVTVNSSSQLEAHCSGSKHRQMLSGQRNCQSNRRFKMPLSPRPKCRIKHRPGSRGRAVVGVTKQGFHCELCQVSVNSETQLKQHMNSRRHKERLAGKPVKTKFTPINKLYPNAFLATKVALQKHLSKVLPAGLLSSPLSPALCNMASGPLALRLPPGLPAIIQGPLISTALFRPAPGPLRATHTPVIFAPY
uniref:C2H2-type domain-containing protein n=1 Tax=Oryzias sinensis TaxID=183150 RepID=A0A8C8DRY3_9TELE